jgi:hypothetical protein
MILLITLLLIKHFILDFYYQPPYMWQNKGTWMHPGGIVHSGLHAIVTYVILIGIVHSGLHAIVTYVILTFWLEHPLGALILAMFEFIVHYLTDYAKMNINRVKGWGATTHNEFWQLTGLDQLVHQMTYVAIVGIIYGFA